MDDAVNTAGEDVVRDDDKPQDASKPTLNQDWFEQPPKPHTTDPEWNKRQVVLGQPEQPWFNQMVSNKKDPLTFNDLMATPIDFSNSIKLEYHFQECFNALTYKLDWNNPEGDRYPFDLSKSLPLQGYLGHLTIAADYFFNNDLKYLKSSDPERTYTISITKIKVARYEIVGIEDVVPMLWSPTKVGVKKLHDYGHIEDIVVKRADRKLYKFKEGDFIDLHLNDIKDMPLLLFNTSYSISTTSILLTLLWLFECSQEVSSSRNVLRIYSLV
ncbi:hypothetical protein Tco_1231741 [Tanacetum coccineum]